MLPDEGISSSLNEGALARSITWQASRHTYYTIRLLADRQRVDDAFRAYAYFRWVDDQIDRAPAVPEERKAFVSRQQSLVEAAFHGEDPGPVRPAERLAVELIRTDGRPGNGLAIYMRSMMEVMAFDAERRGRWVSQAELDGYTHSLAVAVTEAIHHFIGHGRGGAHTPDRYLAVAAAHITHMLRDTREDVDAGYYNIPLEVLSAARIAPGEMESPAYRSYVQQRVARARREFELGKAYFAQVDSWRCRLAAIAYCARFEAVLDAIERNDHDLTAAFRLSPLAPAAAWSAGLAAALTSPRQPRPRPASLDSPSSSSSQAPPRRPDSRP